MKGEIWCNIEVQSEEGVFVSEAAFTASVHIETQPRQRRSGQARRCTLHMLMRSCAKRQLRI